MGFKKIFFILVLSCACFGGGFIMGENLRDKPDAVAENPIPETVNTVLAADSIEYKTKEPEIMPTEKPEKSEYLLMLSGNSICIYSLLNDGTTKLVQSKEIDIEQLRTEDFQNLCRGVTVDSLDKAIALCEDYGN